jgi:hypothetical protein
MRTVASAKTANLEIKSATPILQLSIHHLVHGIPQR